jgi:hypothetical protein
MVGGVGGDAAGSFAVLPRLHEISTGSLVKLFCRARPFACCACVCMSPPPKDVDLDFEEMRDVDVNVTPALDLTHHLVKMFKAHGPVSSALGLGSLRGDGGSSGVKGRGGDAVGVGGGNPFSSLDSLAGLFGPNGVVWEEFSSSLDGALREAKVVSSPVVAARAHAR